MRRTLISRSPPPWPCPRSDRPRLSAGRRATSSPSTRTAERRHDHRRQQLCVRTAGGPTILQGCPGHGVGRSRPRPLQAASRRQFRRRGLRRRRGVLDPPRHGADLELKALRPASKRARSTTSPSRSKRRRRTVLLRQLTNVFIEQGLGGKAQHRQARTTSTRKRPTAPATPTAPVPAQDARSRRAQCSRTGLVEQGGQGRQRDRGGVHPDQAERHPHRGPAVRRDRLRAGPGRSGPGPPAPVGRWSRATIPGPGPEASRAAVLEHQGRTRSRTSACGRCTAPSTWTPSSAP